MIAAHIQLISTNFVQNNTTLTYINNTVVLRCSCSIGNLNTATLAIGSLHVACDELIFKPKQYVYTYVGHKQHPYHILDISM